MTLKEKHEQEIKDYLTMAESIETATDYNDNHLKWGSSCDSSDKAQFRVAWVKKAEKEFLKKHKKQILKNAAEMIRTYIGH